MGIYTGNKKAFWQWSDKRNQISRGKHLDTFRQFVGEILKLDFVTEDVAKEYIYNACEIGSRAALTSNKGAEARFHTLIRNPYNEWFSKHVNPKDTIIPK